MPPLATGTVLREMAGVVVPVATTMGDVPVTLVTVPFNVADQDVAVPLVVSTVPEFPV